MLNPFSEEKYQTSSLTKLKNQQQNSTYKNNMDVSMTGTNYVFDTKVITLREVLLPLRSQLVGRGLEATDYPWNILLGRGTPTITPLVHKMGAPSPSHSCCFCRGSCGPELLGSGHFLQGDRQGTCSLRYLTVTALKGQPDNIRGWEPRITQVCYCSSLLYSPNSFLVFQSADIHKASVFQPLILCIIGHSNWMQKAQAPLRFLVFLSTTCLLSPAVFSHSTCCLWWWSTLVELGFLDISTTGSTSSWLCEHLLGTSSQSVQAPIHIASITPSGPSGETFLKPE